MVTDPHEEASASTTIILTSIVSLLCLVVLTLSCLHGRIYSRISGWLPPCCKCCDNRTNVDPMFPRFTNSIDGITVDSVVFEPLPDQVLSIVNQNVNLDADFESPGDSELVLDKTVSRSDVTFTQSIGHGRFGWVMTGTLKDYGRVVIKILREESSPEAMEKFLRGHEVWQGVSHANVTKIIGSCFTTFPLMSLLEHSEHISAKTYLLSLQDQPDLDLSLQLGMDACAGLAALHTQRIAVPDLSVRNCVLDKYFMLKIGNLGLGRSLYPGDYWPLMTDTVPLRWSSPGQFRRPANWSVPSYSAPGLEDNLWTLGILIWELLTYCKQPYKDIQDKQVFEILLGGKEIVQYFEAEPKSNLKYKCVSMLAAHNLSADASRRYSAAKMEEELGLVARTGRQHMAALYRHIEAGNREVSSAMAELNNFVDVDLDITDFAS